MTNSQDYRLYLDEKFSHVKTQLDRIEEHVLRTNGRVSKLEEEDERIEKKVDDAIAFGKHIIDTRATECPQVKEIEKIRENLGNLEVVSFFSKHPKILAFTLVGILTFGIVSVALSVYNGAEVRVIKANIEQLGTPVITNPRGVVQDSVKVKMWPKDFEK